MNYVQYAKNLSDKIHRLENSTKYCDRGLARELSRVHKVLCSLIEDAISAEEERRTAITAIQRVANGDIIKRAVAEELEKVRKRRIRITRR